MEPRQGPPKLPYEGMPVNQGEVHLSQESTGEYLVDGHFETAAEHPARVETDNLPPVVSVVPMAIPVVQDDNAQALITDDASSNPVVAADEDLIEKEWVDKAKKIIEETKENPYRRELEIGKLQRDYIRKRYGRELGEPGGK